MTITAAQAAPALPHPLATPHHVDHCQDADELQALYDRIMTGTAQQVENTWQPPAPVPDGTTLTPFALGLLKQRAQQDAQVRALELAGFREEHAHELQAHRKAPSRERTADEIEQWRATRERSSIIKARKAQRRADKLEAALNRDAAARGQFDHGHINQPLTQRPGLSLDSAIDHATALQEARRDAEHHQSRARYWATWEPKVQP